MKKDFENYLLSVQTQRDKMWKAVEEANSLAKEGNITNEQVAAIQAQLNLLEANYQRLVYCKYLYNLPPKFIQKIRSRKLAKQLNEFMENNADKTSVEKENEEAIEKVKEVIEKND